MLSSASNQERLGRENNIAGGDATYRRQSLRLVGREVFVHCGELLKRYGFVYATSPGNILQNVRIHFKKQKPTGVMV